MLSHVAYITRDTAATADFYTRILGMELVNAVLDDAIPSTGEPVPYFHSFFRMADGSTIAFFEAPELPPAGRPPHAAYDTFQHLAMQVDTHRRGRPVARWLGRERRRGARARRPQDHLQHLLPRPERAATRDHHAARRRRGTTTPRPRGRASTTGRRSRHGPRRRGDDMVAVLNELTRRAQSPATRRRGSHGDPEARSASTTTSSSRRTSGSAGCPAKYRDRGPKVVRRGIREIDYVGTASYVEHFDDESPTKVDCWIYEDLVYTHKRMVAAVGLPQRGDDPHADHLRRHAPGLLRPEGAPRRHGRELGRGVDVLPDPSPVLRPDVPRGQRQGPRPRLRQGVQRLDGRGVVRRLRWPADPARDHPALGRRARRRRGAAQRRHAACGRCASASCPYHLGLPTIHSGYWEPFFAACAETGTVVAMHIGSSSKMPAASPDAPPSVSATLGVRQRDVVAGRLPDVRAARPHSRPQADLRREPDRLDPVRAAARRPGVGGQPGVGADQAHPRAAVDLLLRQRLRLRHQRPARARSRSTRSASTTSRARPTTRTPTRAGPTPRRS